MEQIYRYLWEVSRAWSILCAVFGFLGVLTFLPYFNRWEKVAVERTRRWFWGLALACLFVAQYQAWRASDLQLVAARERITGMELTAERERGTAAARVARLEGRADAVDDQRAEARRLLDAERGRSESLQDELRRQAVEAARKPVESPAWLDDGLVRLAAHRPITHATQKEWHGLLLIFQHAGPPQTVSFKITCACKLEEVQANYADRPTGVYVNKTGLLGATSARVSISDPPFRAEASLLVQLYSKEPVRVTAIDPL